MRLHSRRRHAALPVLLLLGLAATPARAESSLACGLLPGLMGRYHDMHVAWREPDPKLDARFADLFIRRLDPAKVLLLESEAEALKKRLQQLLADVRKGSCDGLEALKQDQLRWHRDMEAFVRKMAGREDLVIDRTVELRVDPDERPRPRTPAERDELRRKMVHFQLANYVIAGEKLPEAKKKLIHRYELITRRVREQTDTDLKSLLLDTYASALDPHSGYLSSEALENFRISMDLSLEGIGAVLRSDAGYTIVERVVPGGPADREGTLQADDKIISVGQGEKGEMVNVIDMALDDVVQLIRGKKGTKVRLGILRQGAQTRTMELTLVRDAIDLRDQAARLRWQKVERNGRTLNLAVLDLPSFYGGRGNGARQCTEDVAALLKEAKEKGADGLVLDLSANSGGLLSAAVDISGYFLRTGAVVGIDGAGGPMKVLEDQDEAIQFDGPLVVLISRGSASASEIVAGALKDYRRAVIVGDDHTFGKGTVQNMIDLPLGWGALKVTMALFYRPGGQSTQSTGVTADIVVPSPLNRDSIGEKEQPYALEPRKTEPFRSTTVNAENPNRRWKPVTDEQIKALAALSAARIAKSEAFAEVRAELEKARRNEGIVRLADLLAEGKGEDEKDEKKDDEALSPQAREALEILADLVAGAGDGTLADGPRPAPPTP